MKARLVLCLLLVLAACASSGGLALQPGPDSPDTIGLQPVQNLAGVSLRVPEMYVGDMLGGDDPLEVQEVDLSLVAQAALLAGLRMQRLAVVTHGQPRFVLYPAITQYDALALRTTGKYRMELTLIMVDTRQDREVARATAAREFLLFEKPPEEGGAMGEARFIRRRLEGFTEALARDALQELGLR